MVLSYFVLLYNSYVNMPHNHIFSQFRLGFFLYLETDVNQSTQEWSDCRKLGNSSLISVLRLVFMPSIRTR